LEYSDETLKATVFMYSPKIRSVGCMKAGSSGRRPLGYGVGSLAILVASIGVAVVVYSTSLIPFNLPNILAWVFGPWGAYTIVYAFATSRDFTYYLTWGTIMFVIALASALYAVISPLVMAGILLIILAIIGVATYWRGRR
jgi:hypothetical protein